MNQGELFKKTTKRPKRRGRKEEFQAYTESGPTCMTNDNLDTMIKALTKISRAFSRHYHIKNSEGKIVWRSTSLEKERG